MKGNVIISLFGLLLISVLSLEQNCHGHSIQMLMLHLIAQIEDVAVIEWHVMSITTKDKKMILEDHACVTVPGSRPLPLHVEDLGLIRSAHHRRAVRVTRSTVIPAAGSLSLAHLLIVGVVIRGLMILDKEGLRHAV